MVVCTAWIFILFQLEKILVALKPGQHNVGSVASWRMRKDEQGLSKKLNVPQSSRKMPYTKGFLEIHKKLT